MSQRILDARGRPVPRQVVRGRYDAAATSPESAQHWAGADALSARAANSAEVRAKLRTRSRYERDNNTYASGIVETIANDTVGTGPRLQLLGGSPAANRRVSDAFEEWTAGVGLAEKLRTYREARAVDGETFALLMSNPPLPTPVKLDLRLVEAEQVTDGMLDAFDGRGVDGIRYDRWGNPSSYRVLRDHPGDNLTFEDEADDIPARFVLHWFRRRRPGQARGIPELTPALPLFALLRRYTLAVLSSAEIAAMFAALVKSNLPPDDDPAEKILPFDTQNIVRGMMTMLPDGYEMQQLRAEQPTTTYADFKHEILDEIARCLQVPSNVARGNSSGYNYSSGRLDHQVYFKSLDVDRYFLETAVLDRLLVAWLEECRLVDPGALRGIAPYVRLPLHEWFWDGHRHVDPEKEANAATIRLLNGTTTLADEWGEEGYDWRLKADQQAAEREYYAGLGIPFPGAVTPPAPAAPPRGPAPESPEDGGEDVEPATAD